jgi:hypothetical protein
VQAKTRGIEIEKYIKEGLLSQTVYQTRGVFPFLRIVMDIISGNSWTGKTVSN